jgi:cupin 2 domain-containing protein
MCRRSSAHGYERIVAIAVKNIFADLPQQIDGEQFLKLFQTGSANIERIVSRSHSSPLNFWYDQSEDEWVIVLRGEATLEFEVGERVELKVGDYLTIPRHVRHRVVSTSEETIWLAMHGN